MINGATDADPRLISRDGAALLLRSSAQWQLH